MKILMIDDHLMFLQGLRNLLALLAPQHSVEIASGLAQALELLHLGEPELVLLDWHLPEAEGEVSLERLRDAGCTARIVILSGENSRALMARAIEHGAAGFIPKAYSSEMMLAALARILDGGIYLPATAAGSALGAPSDGAAATPFAALSAALTPRQLDIWRAAARGLPNKLIARELGIAEATVKTHLTAVYGVLGVRNRTEAAILASREGLKVA